MAGLVMLNLMGGDYAYSIVDDERWRQMSSLNEDDMPSDNRRKRYALWKEVQMWLVNTDGDRPDYAPDPVGRVIKTFYTQSGVVERVDVEDRIVGVLSINCS